MFNLDLSTIEAPQAKEFELIPNGTIAPVIINIKGVKPTNAGDAQMLDIEFTVTAGDYARRKVFGLFMVKGNGTPGHTMAVEISSRKFLEIAQSAFGITDPTAPDAAAFLKSFNTDSIQGAEFLARIGIEKDKTGQYSDKNVVAGAVTPSDKRYNFKPPPLPLASAAPAPPASAQAQSTPACAS